MKTADVKFLVREVLNTLPSPYTEHVNYRDELVMLVMEGMSSEKAFQMVLKAHML